MAIIIVHLKAKVFITTICSSTSMQPTSHVLYHVSSTTLELFYTLVTQMNLLIMLLAKGYNIG